MSPQDPDIATLEKLLVDISADGVVTKEESYTLAEELAKLREKYAVADAVYDARSLGLPKMGLLGVQHMFAMFGATILVPILTGLSPSATLLWAGLGTLLFHLFTKRMVPAFLGSSFAYLAGYFAMAGMAGTAGYEDCTKATMLQYACLGVASSSLVYFVVAWFVKACGVKTVMKFFPPVVTGPIIIGIGLVLAPVAINSCTSNWLVALVAIATVISFSIFGRGMFKIIPILMGVIASYLAAVVLGAAGLADSIDYSGVASAAWVGLPVKMENTVFPLLASPDWGKIVSAIAIVFPLAFATIMEHVGDVSAISSTVGRNFFANPGLHRTMLGDGCATMLASLFGAPANTTYGENTGVLSLSKVYDPRVIRIAACLAILVSFCPKFSAFIGTIPPATIGGVSFILYGMISAVGVRNLVESQVDLGKSRNMLIAALILVLTLGISFSKAGAIAFNLGTIKISLSGLAVGALMGIILNAILPGKDFAFSETAPTIKDADRFGGVKPDTAK
ncbi:MAG: uracil-xanthine permease [Kiritimatiellae bacterium]|nr:uracil-xanthine permease [Kiritimatiellia bacterium]